jgi:hypothetical protein
MVMKADEQMHEPSVIRPLRDVCEGGFEVLAHPLETLRRWRAWSKLGDGIGVSGHEESKPAR